MSDILRIGVIGGSGLYQMDGLINIREEEVETPFGRPSAPFLICLLYTSPRPRD